MLPPIIFYHNEVYNERTITESIGVSDSKQKLVNRYRTISDIIGNLDVISKVKYAYKSIIEQLALLDTWFRQKHIYRIFVEKLGEVPLVEEIINWITGKKYRDSPAVHIEIYPEE